MAPVPGHAVSAVPTTPDKKGLTMRGWGIMLMIIGIGSFFMASYGYQFMLISIFKPHETLAGIGMTLLGLVLLIAGVIRARQSPQ
jgi:hypothetical protein